MSREHTDAYAAMRNQTTNGVIWATNGRRLGIIGRRCDVHHVLHPRRGAHQRPEDLLDRAAKSLVTTACMGSAYSMGSFLLMGGRPPAGGSLPNAPSWWRRRGSRGSWITSASPARVPRGGLIPPRGVTLRSYQQPEVAVPPEVAELWRPAWLMVNE